MVHAVDVVCPDSTVRARAHSHGVACAFFDLGMPTDVAQVSGTTLFSMPCVVPH